MSRVLKKVSCFRGRQSGFHGKQPSFMRFEERIQCLHGKWSFFIRFRRIAAGRIQKHIGKCACCAVRIREFPALSALSASEPATKALFYSIQNSGWEDSETHEQMRLLRCQDSSIPSTLSKWACYKGIYSIHGPAMATTYSILPPATGRIWRYAPVAHPMHIKSIIKIHSFSLFSSCGHGDLEEGGNVMVSGLVQHM